MITGTKTRTRLDRDVVSARIALGAIVLTVLSLPLIISGAIFDVHGVAATLGWVVFGFGFFPALGVSFYRMAVELD